MRRSSIYWLLIKVKKKKKGLTKKKPISKTQTSPLCNQATVLRMLVGVWHVMCHPNLILLSNIYMIRNQVIKIKFFTYNLILIYRLLGLLIQKFVVGFESCKSLVSFHRLATFGLKFNLMCMIAANFIVIFD